MSSSFLATELEYADRLFDTGRADGVIDRFSFVLSQMNSDNHFDKHDHLKVLKSLAKAAIVTKQFQLACSYSEKLVKTLDASSFGSSKKYAYLCLESAEILADLKSCDESNACAEKALHALADCIDDFDLDEIADILRRYSTLAGKIGILSSAYLALTVGLLVVQDASGLDSLIAVEAAKMTALACKAAHPAAIGRLGCILLSRAA